MPELRTIDQVRSALDLDAAELKAEELRLRGVPGRKAQWRMVCAEMRARGLTQRFSEDRR